MTRRPEDIITSNLVIAKATTDDLPEIKKLDGTVFPEQSLDFEPASEEELTIGVERGEIFLAKFEGNLVGFIHFEAIGPKTINLVSLAVSPALHGKGIGKKLMQFMSSQISDAAEEITCVTSPRNGPMIKVLLQSNFVGTALVKSYFGEGKDRLVFKRKNTEDEYLLGGSDFVPLHSSEAITILMATGDRQISRIHFGAQGPLLEISKTIKIDLADARNNEASTSVSQASGILAALTFLLGLSFTEESYSVELRIFLIIAVVITVGAVQVYANSTGSVLRSKDSSFDGHMKMGNLLLDFGGHYPLVIVVPAIFVSFDLQFELQILVATVVTCLLLAYEISRYSIFSRYRIGVVNVMLMVLTSLLPLVSVWSQFMFSSQLQWVLIALFILSLRFARHASRKSIEGTARARKRA